jgi:hypothetical protein
LLGIVNYEVMNELENLEFEWKWIFIWWKPLSLINKTKHPTKREQEITRWKRTQVLSWQTKNPTYEEGGPLRGTWTNQALKQRILQRGWIAKGTWTNQVPKPSQSPWEAYEIRRGNTSISICFGWMQMRKVNDREERRLIVLQFSCPFPPPHIHKQSFSFSSHALLCSFLVLFHPHTYTNKAFH